MRIAGREIAAEQGTSALDAAYEAGFTLFDHADIYADGESERLFGKWLRESPRRRDDLVIQGKCGIRTDAPKRYDASRDHIVSSVEASLQRLGIEQLDVLLLHRPDFLADFDEVGAAFDALRSSGKVAEFGVSNYPAENLRTLQSSLSVRLQVNQVEINIHNTEALENGVLDQAQTEGISVQAWCPLAGIAWEAWGNTFTSEQSERLRAEAGRQAAVYGVDRSQVALLWLLRHPAKISPIVGSTTPERIAGAPALLDIDYSRDDWYRLLEARNGHPVA